jgi:hypothetical protein
LLTQKDALPTSTETSLNNLGVTQVVIIGGEGVVSAAVETTLKASYSVTRIGGTDRFDTAGKVADVAVKAISAGGFGMNKREVYLAEMGAASGGADAIAAGQIVNADGSVLLGLSGGTLPAATSAWLGANKAGATGLTVGIIGGTGVVPTATEATIKTAAGGDSATVTATITARAGQTTFTVTFSEPILKSSCANAGDVVVIAAATGADAATTACTMTTVPSTALSGTTAVFTTAALTKGDEVRILKGTLATADGRTVGLTTGTVAGDTTKPSVTLTTVINATGTIITAKFSEPVKRVDAFVDGDLKIAGVANTSSLKGGVRLGATVVEADATEITALAANSVFDSMTITRADAFAVGTAVQLVAGAVQDLAGNTNTAGNGTITSDTTAPTIVGNPTVVQAVGAAAVYSLDNKLLLTRKVAGSTGNDYDVIWAQPANATATTETCTAAGENITLIFTTPATAGAGGLATTSTAATMKATIDASATCSALVTTSIVGAGGAFTAAISAAAQADNAAAATFSGGTHTMTVVTTFSEAIKSTGAPAGSISYDGGADNGALVANTAAKTTVNGAVVTTVHSVIVDGDVFVPGTTTIDYTNAIIDVAGNTLVAVADKVALVG